MVLTAETKEEAELKLSDWRQAMARRGMNINIATNRVMATGKNAGIVKSGRYPYAVCGKYVSQNSIFARSVVSGAITHALVCVV